MGNTKGISRWLPRAVGVSSGAELLDAAGGADVLDAVAEGSFVHEGGTTAGLFTTLGLHRTSN